MIAFQPVSNFTWLNAPGSDHSSLVGFFFSLRPVLGCVLNFEKRREFPIKSNRKPHFFTVRLALVLACFFYVRFGVTAFVSLDMVMK